MSDVWSELNDRCESAADSPAITDPGGSWTWQQVRDSATATAGRLTGTGPLLILAPSSRHWAGAMFACAAAGRPSVCLGLARDAELDWAIRRTEATAVLFVPDQAPAAQRLAALHGIDAVPISGPEPSGRAHGRKPDPRAPIYYHLTSGSTGIRRLVERRHDDVLLEGQTVARRLSLTGRDCLVCTTGAYHSFCGGLLTAALCSGSESVLVPSLDCSAIIAAGRRATIMAGVPYVFSLLGRLTLPSDLWPQLRFCLAGGAPVNAALAHRFASQFGAPLCQEYGLSESGIVSINLDDPWEQPESMGRPLPGYEAWTIDPERPHTRVGTGRPGELVIRRPRSPRRYVGETALDVFVGPDEVRTGDIVRIADDGHLHFSGRRKMMINVAGSKAAPREVESALLAVPGVDEAFVAAVPDVHTGEAVGAVVLPLPGHELDAERVRAAVRGSLSPFKVPKRLIIADDVPRTNTGKPDLRAIDRLLSELTEGGIDDGPDPGSV